MQQNTENAHSTDPAVDWKAPRIHASAHGNKSTLAMRKHAPHNRVHVSAEQDIGDHVKDMSGNTG